VRRTRLWCRLWRFDAAWRWTVSTGACCERGDSR
jgi:hypothetical protein